jgi:hypothetical protein
MYTLTLLRCSTTPFYSGDDGSLAESFCAERELLYKYVTVQFTLTRDRTTSDYTFILNHFSRGGAVATKTEKTQHIVNEECSLATSGLCLAYSLVACIAENKKREDPKIQLDSVFDKVFKKYYGPIFGPLNVIQPYFYEIPSEQFWSRCDNCTDEHQL